jgi:hypothetical protein
MKYVRGYLISNGEIFECDFDVHWEEMLAVVRKCAKSEYIGTIATSRQWCVVLDTAMHTAKRQCELIMKAIAYDPIALSNWQIYYDNVRSGHPNIHRMLIC